MKLKSYISGLKVVAFAMKESSDKIWRKFAMYNGSSKFLCPLAMCHYSLS